MDLSFANIHIMIVLLLLLAIVLFIVFVSVRRILRIIRLFREGERKTAWKLIFKTLGTLAFIAISIFFFIKYVLIAGIALLVIGMMSSKDVVYVHH